jgi:protein O-GlcNAc transferase
MAAGERVVSQRGFDSPALLASEIVEQLLVQVFTGDLITLLRPDLAHQDRSIVEEQKPSIAAAVERLAEDKDVDLLALAKNPKDIDLADLEAKLKTRAEAHEAAGRSKLAEGTANLKSSAEYWRHIGALAFLHDTQKALAVYEKAVTLDPDSPDGWLNLGRLQFRMGDLKSAEHCFNSLVKLGEQKQDKRIEAMGYFHLVQVHGTRGDLFKAEKIQLKALDLDEQQGDKNSQPGAYINLGNIYHSQGDLAKAEEMFHKALQLSKEIGSKENMAIASGALGILIHHTRGELSKAEEMLSKALELNEEIGRKEGIAANYGNLGLIFQERGDLAKAEEMQAKSLALNDQLRDKQGLANVYGNLALIHRDRGDFNKAEQALLKCQEYNEALGSKEGIAAVFLNLGAIYEIQRKWQNAEEMHLKSLALFEEVGAKEGIATCLTNLGTIYAATRDSRMCGSWRKARGLWQEMGLSSKIALVDEWLKVHGCETD